MVHRHLKEVESRITKTHHIPATIREMKLQSAFCHEGVIRASRNDQKSLIDLEIHYCGEGIVAAALRPDIIPAPPDEAPDPTIEFLNEQIRRQTRADKILLWQSDPEEWDFWGDIYWGEERRREGYREELEESSRLEWHGLRLKGQEILAEVRAAKKRLGDGRKSSGWRTWRHGIAGWNDLEEVSSVDDSESRGALYSALADQKASLLDAIDRAFKSQATSELPYGSWEEVLVSQGEPAHPQFVPPETEVVPKGARLAVNLGIGRQPWDYLGFASQTAHTRPLRWDAKRHKAIGDSSWESSVVGGFLLAAALVGCIMLFASWANRRKANCEERRGRVRPDEELALERKRNFELNL